MMKWSQFFPARNLQYAPSFTGKAVCYASADTHRGYLSWRQADCHINNQYNTCYWLLVQYWKNKVVAQDILRRAAKMIFFSLSSKLITTTSPKSSGKDHLYSGRLWTSWEKMQIRQVQLL
eukprot:TRINITY_DN4966_c0_g1_i1.p1 TRINITY_DN4966_c0_g1~~TRINITY_DN4966_c0_g1_i1.p1  ORF type:complete len:120 (+),score=7.42 TRINITY_DN4966_c0_g1_i1:239-598(+)